jgi:hypothetical protein
LRRIFDTARFFGDDGTVPGVDLVAEVTLRGEPAPSLRAAWLHRGLCWSADRPDWRAATITILVREAPGEWRTEKLVNAYSAQLSPDHKAALGAHVSVLPDYEDPGHHNPTRPEHAKYKNEKSKIPEQASRILRHAVPEDGQTTWWARCEHGFYHRFQGSERNGWVCVHWNGTTNPNATGNLDRRTATTEHDVTPNVKERLAKMPPVSDCGCRDVP